MVNNIKCDIEGCDNSRHIDIGFASYCYKCWKFVKGFYKKEKVRK